MEQTRTVLSVVRGGGHCLAVPWPRSKLSKFVYELGGGILDGITGHGVALRRERTSGNDGDDDDLDRTLQLFSHPRVFARRCLVSLRGIVDFSKTS